MKILSLFLALTVIAVLTAMLTAMSADASSQRVADTVPAAAAASASMTPTRLNAGEPAAAEVTRVSGETPRKNIKKRSRSKCARITSTCWGNA